MYCNSDALDIPHKFHVVMLHYLLWVLLLHLMDSAQLTCQLAYHILKQNQSLHVVWHMSH